MIIIAIIIALAVGSAVGVVFADWLNTNWHRRWREQNALVANLQDDLAQAETHTMALPVGNLQAVVAPTYHTYKAGQTGPTSASVPWKVSARTIQGVTSIYAKRGTEMEELERVPKASASYDEKLAKAVSRATRTVAAKNDRS